MSIEAPKVPRGKPANLLEVLGRKTKDLKQLGGEEHRRDVREWKERRGEKTDPGEMLLDAAFRGDKSAILMYLRRDDVSINYTNSEGWSALHYAVFYSHTECVQFILTQGANVSLAMKNGVTPLLLTAQNGNLRLAELLLQKGAKLSAKDQNGATALYVAASLGHCEIARLLISKNASLHAVDNDGNSPLHVAAQEGHYDMVKLLLSHKCNPDLPNLDGWTSVHFAARKAHVEVLTVLEEEGANINARTIEGATPLYLSTESLATVEFLVRNGAEIDALYSLTGNSPLYIASWNGHTKSAMFLVEHGADANIRNSQENTPLHAAARSGSARLVAGLLTRGRAEPNCQNTTGATPLYIAAAFNNLQTVLGLAQFDVVDIDLPTLDGGTPLYLACWRGFQDVAQALLRRGADTETRYRQGNTPLIGAAFNGHRAICDLLLHYHAKINSVTEAGLTALHCATYRSHPEVVQILVLRGARQDIVAKNGRTAVECARSENMRTLYRKLALQQRQHPTSFKWKPPPLSEEMYDPRLKLPEPGHYDRRAPTPKSPAYAPAPVPSAKVAEATAAAMSLLSPQHRIPLSRTVRAHSDSDKHQPTNHGEVVNADWRPGDSDAELETLFSRLADKDASGGEPFLTALLKSLRDLAQGKTTFGPRVDSAVRQMIPRIKDQQAQRDVQAALERLRALLYGDVDHNPQSTPVMKKTQKPSRDVMVDINMMMREHEDAVDPDQLLSTIPDLSFGEDNRASWPRKSHPPQTFTNSSAAVSPASSEAASNSPRAHPGLRGTWPLNDDPDSASNAESSEVVIDMDSIDQHEFEMLVNDVESFQF